MTPTLAPPPRLSVRALQKRYRRTIAVADVSFEVGAGELVGLIGPNGAGKSTTVRIITGQVVADSGEATIDGHRIDTAAMAARRVTGYVPQRLTLYPFLTGRETLDFVGAARGLPAETVRARGGALLERLGLGEAADRLAREYSEGMARKLAVATALLAEPPLLVLDESLTGLDPRSAAEVKELLRDRVAAGGAVLLVSHQLAALERLCTRILLIDRGRVRAGLDRAGLDELLQGGSSLERFFLDHTGATPDRGVAEQAPG